MAFLQAQRLLQNSVAPSYLTRFVVNFARVLKNFSEKCVAAKNILRYTTNPAADGYDELTLLREILDKQLETSRMLRSMFFDNLDEFFERESGGGKSQATFSKSTVSSF